MVDMSSNQTKPSHILNAVWKFELLMPQCRDRKKNKTW